MADTIMVKAGRKETMPVLLYKELGFCYDTKELYVGTGAGNLLVGAVAWKEDIEGKLTAVQAEATSQLSAEATTTDIITKMNELITALQTAGIMKTGEM